MLERADIGVIVASPDGYVLETDGEFLRSTETGPRGWAEAMTKILDHFNKP